MEVWQAVLYYLMWSLVCFFGISWFKHFELLVVPKFWQHSALALVGGLLIGAGWYIFARDFISYLY